MRTPNYYASKSFSKVGHDALRHVPNYMKSTPGLTAQFRLVREFKRPVIG